MIRTLIEMIRQIISRMVVVEVRSMHTPMHVEPKRVVPKAEPTRTAVPKTEPRLNENGNPIMTEQEVQYIISRKGDDMRARVTKHGNVILQHKDATKTLFAFYKRADGYIIRRRLGYDNPFGSGHVLNGGKTLPTLKATMDYFEEYKKKWPTSLR